MPVSRRACLDDENGSLYEERLWQRQGMLKQTMESYMRSYHITLGVYAAIFGIGLSLMVWP